MRQIHTTIVSCILVIMLALQPGLSATSNVAGMHMTLDAHPYCSQKACMVLHSCITQALRVTRDPFTIRERVQMYVPHVLHIHIHYKAPSHIHCRVVCQRPQACIMCTEDTYVITQAACVPSWCIPEYIQQRLPRIIWKSEEHPVQQQEHITDFVRQVSRLWCFNREIIWHTPYDIRLYAQKAPYLHIRTKADRQLSQAAYQEIMQIMQDLSIQSGHIPTWIDIRFPRYVVVSHATERRNHADTQ